MVGAINSGVRMVPAWPIYAVSFAYMAWLFWRGIIGELGPNPVEAIEHALGEAALYLLIGGLTVTPLRRYAKINLLKFRRAIGLACFLFLSAHLLTWAILDVQALDRVWADIVKRPYITVGMAAFVLLLPLAMTSNNLSVRKLGAVWHMLHKLVYPAAVLGAVHYVMLVKGWQTKPLVLLAIIVFLIMLRLPWLSRSKRKQPTPTVRVQS